jgi:hypothetical protein
MKFQPGNPYVVPLLKATKSILAVCVVVKLVAVVSLSEAMKFQPGNPYAGAGCGGGGDVNGIWYW